MHIRGGQGEYVARWMAERLEDMPLPPYEAIGAFDDDGVIQFAVIYNMMRGGSIEVSLAVDSHRGVSRKIISDLLSYPFSQLGLNRITAYVDSDNIKSISLIRRLGFIHEGTMRCALLSGDNQELYGLTKEDFQKGKYNEPKISYATRPI